MTRLLSAALFAACAIGVASLSLDPAAAQDTKAKAKQPAKPARIAVSEPKELAADKDYATQGEYAGKSDCEKFVWGVQVVAKGEGKFDVKIHTGGLPGAGWDGKTVTMAKAVRTDAGTEVKDGEKSLGTVADGVFKIVLGDFKGSLKKVDRQSRPSGPSRRKGRKCCSANRATRPTGPAANWSSCRTASS